MLRTERVVPGFEPGGAPQTPPPVSAPCILSALPVAA
jgi:hypothetical protein